MLHFLHMERLIIGTHMVLKAGKLAIRQKYPFNEVIEIQKTFTRVHGRYLQMPL